MRPRSSHRAIVALGSNLGDREGYLRFALGELGGVVAQSQVFETDPVGGPDEQGAYLNMVVAVDTPLDPFAFLRRCQRIEAGALRQRIVHWGPRTLDVDVLFYDDVTMSSPELTIPHPLFDRAPVRADAAGRGGAGALPAGLGRARCAPAGVYPRGPLARLTGRTATALASTSRTCHGRWLRPYSRPWRDDDLQHLLVLR